MLGVKKEEVAKIVWCVWEIATEEATKQVEMEEVEEGGEGVFSVN